MRRWLLERWHRLVDCDECDGSGMLLVYDWHAHEQDVVDCWRCCGCGFRWGVLKAWIR